MINSWSEYFHETDVRIRRIKILGKEFHLKQGLRVIGVNQRRTTKARKRAEEEKKRIGVTRMKVKPSY